MPSYSVTGTMPGRDADQPFAITVEAPNEDVAEERAFAELGSKHGHRRTRITIDEIAPREEVAA